MTLDFSNGTNSDHHTGAVITDNVSVHLEFLNFDFMDKIDMAKIFNELSNFIGTSNCFNFKLKILSHFSFGFITHT